MDAAILGEFAAGFAYEQSRWARRHLVPDSAWTRPVLGRLRSAAGAAHPTRCGRRLLSGTQRGPLALEPCHFRWRIWLLLHRWLPDAIWHSHVMRSSSSLGLPRWQGSSGCTPQLGIWLKPPLRSSPIQKRHVDWSRHLLRRWWTASPRVTSRRSTRRSGATSLLCGDFMS